MVMWLTLIGAAIFLVALVALYYYLFDAPSIDDEESEAVAGETPAERAEVIARHREQIENARLDSIEDTASN